MGNSEALNGLRSREAVREILRGYSSLRSKDTQMKKKTFTVIFTVTQDFSKRKKEGFVGDLKDLLRTKDEMPAKIISWRGRLSIELKRNSLYRLVKRWDKNAPKVRKFSKKYLIRSIHLKLTDAHIEYLKEQGFKEIPTKLQIYDFLDHEGRAETYAVIKENPGLMMEDFLKFIKNPRSTIRFHTRELEMYKLIKCQQDGKYVRFYEKGVKPSKYPKFVNDTQRKIYGLLIDSQPLTQKEITKELKYSQQVVSYHLNKLVKSKFVKVAKEKGVLRYSV